MPAGDQSDRLLVVHGHAAERFPDVVRGSERVRLSVRALRVHVDQAHLDGGERVRELAVAAVALVAEPFVLGAPVDVVRLPHVLAPAAEAERLEAHRLEGAIAREDEEIGPRDLPSVLLLYRPEQPARLVEIDVVGPTVEGREALHAGARPATAVADPVCPGAVPRHADDERAVVAPVGRPPVLRRRQHLDDVLFQYLEVEGRELRGVVEVLAHRIPQRIGRLEQLQVKRARPPVAVRPGRPPVLAALSAFARDRACLRLFHALLSSASASAASGTPAPSQCIGKQRSRRAGS